MPQLVDGQWVKDDVAASEMKNGAFHREPTRFRDQTIAAEPGRYQLFVAYICPWASRTLMMRKLKGLDLLLPVAIAEPELGEDGWRFSPPIDAGDRIAPVRFQHELYTGSDPHYTGKVSVPVLWDRQLGRIVNNESADILRILNQAFDGLTGDRQDFYPEPMRGEIDRWNALIYDSLNNGVYRAGFAKSQAAYEEAVAAVFATLDRLEAHLADHRYLAGVYFTEADIRLFVTLIRFDAAYHGAFKCNLRRLSDYANLQAYLREIYQWPGIAETVRVDHIKRGYYSIAHLNPTRIVPAGPIQDLAAAHARDHLRGQGIWQRST
ncbi:glutathione-dependent reductase [Xaviernesmea oryzae]|uniref:Glutathione-dependent reductase n=1 Tax=Xaviernesmea oryzae TaxID=464029 RepID=A0A1Q9ATA9_9HYPH|nr:glutathione S-transferase C-terminal domain-containing protein [Xaviernesmea oryzae]OLP58591.1 glutathione-dependent reductase [Xaviernesmea oryzae]SEK63418.1 putative glutathione S-transferase [Xaviernesmea oryzae]